MKIGLLGLMLLGSVSWAAPRKYAPAPQREPRAGIYESTTSCASEINWAGDTMYFEFRGGSAWWLSNCGRPSGPFVMTEVQPGIFEGNGVRIEVLDERMIMVKSGFSNFLFKFHKYN